MSNESSPKSNIRGSVQLDAFIPVVLLALSFIVLLGWQVSNTSTQKGLFEDAIKRQEPAVNQAQQMVTGLTKLATDLLDAAQTDDTAKAIAAKYVQKNGTAAPAASPAASPTK